MKRVYKIVIAFALAFTLVGCRNNTTASNNKDFTSFIEKLPTRLVSDNGFDLNFLFYNAADYGFDKKANGLEVSSIKEVEESYSEIEDLKQELETFDYDSLTKEQQVEYDVLDDYLERTLGLKEYVSLDNSYLGSFVSYQAQLPLLLDEFELNDKKDLEIYLQVLNKAPDTFQKMVDNEKERQKDGTGMSKKLLDGAIEQANNFANGDVTFLITGMQEKIEKADFLSAKEKEEAKQKVEEYTKNNLIQAYQLLKDELSKISPKQIDNGIYGQKDAEEYYLALFHKRTGLTWDIDDIKEYVAKKKVSLYTEYMKLVKRVGEDTDFLSANCGSFDSVEDNVDYLCDTYDKYYPAIKKVDYVAKKVPDSMKDNFSPAAYLSSRIDRNNQPLMIIVNGNYSSSLFETIAHEGYPGHMYQDSYFQQQDVSTFRYLIDCSGYSEGWATYTELNSYRFSKEDNQDLLKMKNINTQLTHLLYIEWDIAINYEGMTRSEFAKSIEDNFGDQLKQEDIDNMYDTLMETPTNYLQYYIVGFYLQDLYDDAKEKLGDKFDEVAFHKTILDLGDTGMDVVKKYVDEYIDGQK